MGVPGRVRARPRVNTVVMPHYIVPCSAAASLCKYTLRRWLSLSPRVCLLLVREQKKMLMVASCGAAHLVAATSRPIYVKLPFIHEVGPARG